MRFAAVCCSLGLMLATGGGNASSIGVYFAADGSDCDATIGLNESFSVYILADLYGDAAASGITGAELWLRNWPTGWPATVYPSPAAFISVGNPLQSTNIAFPSCQTGDANGFVMLYRIDGVATTAVSNVRLFIWRHCCPSNPNWHSALLSICDAVFTLVQVGEGQAFINGPSCNVAVTPVTWTSVKSLYREQE